MNKIIALSIFVLALTCGANSQTTGRFVFNVVDSARSQEVRCLGAAITESHVLVPASCVDGIQHVAVEVREVGRTVLFGMESKLNIFIIENVTTNFLSLVIAERVFTYPQFNRNQNRGNNVAVIQVKNQKLFKFQET